MPINTPHPEYEAMLPVWRDIRAVIKGGRAVKAAGELYLPKLYKQSAEEYAAYKLRAVWFGATAKTADGFVGIITRKPAAYTHPASLQAFLDDCDRRGTSFATYGQAVIRDLVDVGRCGTFIDWTDKAAPYLTHYAAEQIINWRFKRLGAEAVLSMVVLYETSTEWNPLTGHDQPDAYELPQYDQWREFELTGDTPETASVRMRVHRRKHSKKPQGPAAGAADAGEEFVVIEDKMLTRRAQAIPGIPFTIHTSANMSPEYVAKPMLEDLTELNLAHYRASADIWNGRHMAGLPTPWAKCFTSESGQELTLGTTRAWTTDNENAECGMLEMAGTALKCIAEGMDDLKAQMAALGARAIEPQKADAEAVGTVQLRARAESASLVTCAEQASNSLSTVMLWANWITGTNTNPRDAAATVYAKLPADLTGGKMDGPTLTALMATMQNGGISYETFFHNLQAGEMYPDGRTMEDEQAAIEKGKPAPPLSEMDEAEIAATKAKAAPPKPPAAGK